MHFLFGIHCGWKLLIAPHEILGVPTLSLRGAAHVEPMMWFGAIW
jgi:hypothetical protein